MDLKQKAHIGDALAALFSRLLLNEAIPSTHYLSRHHIHSSKMVSNEHFAKVCVRFNLFNTVDPINFFSFRELGTRYEAHLYDIFSEKGYDAAMDFFKQTCYKHYFELHEEVPVLP